MKTSRRDININYLEHLRKGRRILQTDISKELGFSECAYGSKVNGALRFTTQDLMAIIDYLNLSNDEVLRLLGRKE